MVKMRVRACFKCKEYVLIRPNDHKNLLLIKEFEKHHSYHAVITITLEEVKGQYKKFGEDQTQEPPEAI